MNRLEHTKGKKQKCVERVIKLLVIAFISGGICGFATANALHRCKPQATETIALTEVQTTSKPKQTATPTAKAKATEPPTDTSDLQHLGTFRVTAYCACVKCCRKTPNHPYYGVTATGTTVKEGRTIAVDPSVIPYGTTVVIDGHEYVAEDCGGAIKGNRIDIYISDHDRANDYGVKYKDVYIAA